MTLVVEYLGWVDLDLGCSTILLGQKVATEIQGDSGGRIPRFVDLNLGSSPGQLPTAQGGWCNIPNLSQPNQGTRPLESPCRGSLV